MRIENARQEIRNILSFFAENFSRPSFREIRKIRDERKAYKEKKEKQKNGNLISGLKKEVEDIPGVKETKEMTETVRSGQKYHKNSN